MTEYKHYILAKQKFNECTFELQTCIYGKTKLYGYEILAIYSISSSTITIVH